MSEMILEIVDGTDIELTLPVPFDMTLDQGRGPQGPAGPAGGDASVSTLTDVELESLTDLDFLSYDEASSKWKNGPLTGLNSISSEDIEDSTEIGRNVLTAVDAPSAREELGAGTSNFDGNYNSLTGKPSLGTASSSDVNDFDASGSAAAAQAAAEAYADGLVGSVTSDDITDATTVGKAVLTATDAATARTAMGAGTSSLALGTSSTTALAGDTAIPSTPADIGAATAAQGALADSATQPADLGTAAAADTTDFDAAGAASTAQTAAEGYTDTAIASEVSRADAAYATAAQGGKADSATQPGDLATVATSGAYSDLSGTPTLGTAAAADTGTSSGNVPLLSTGGRLPIARIASGTPDGTKFVKDDGTLATPSGGGSVATDTIFDAKGDLAVGTGSDAASKLTVGANGARLRPDSAQTTGLKWVAAWRNPDDPADPGWASPLTYDEEFDTDTSSLPSGWSWVNQGSATYAAAWGAGVLTHPGISSGDDVKAIVRNLPTESAWSATLKLGLAGEDGATGLFTCGMVLRNATSGKMLLIGPRFVNAVAGNSTAVTTFAGFYFSSPTAFDSTAFATLGITGPYKYVRIQKVSGTSWSFYGSADGAVWQLFLSGHDVTAKFTPDQIGFAAYKASSAKTIAAGCHFFRVR